MGKIEAYLMHFLRQRFHILFSGRRLDIVRIAIGIFVFIMVGYTIWPWLPGAHAQPARTIVVYGFSILDDVMSKGIFPAFQQAWQQRTGEQIEFVDSFGGSGTVTNQIILGVPAEVAILSLETDAQRLVDNGVIGDQTWNSLPYHGILNRTPFIIVVRAGNPKGIHDFSDLARPGIRIVHPDPLTSGGAQWAILAEYGSAIQTGLRADQAFEQLLGIWQNVTSQAGSARAAKTQFDNGFGDALITYEQDVVYDRQRGDLHDEIVYPHSTVLSEHTVVMIERNIRPADRALVKAFVDFLWSDAAQRIFVQYGFRSVNEALNTGNPYFGVIPKPFTVNDLGGWLVVKKDIIDGIWKGRVLPEVGK